MRILIENNHFPMDIIYTVDIVNDGNVARMSSVRFISCIRSGDPGRFENITHVENTIDNLHEKITSIGDNKC
jgi:hypothetical protein